MLHIHSGTYGGYIFCRKTYCVETLKNNYFFMQCQSSQTSILVFWKLLH